MRFGEPPDRFFPKFLMATCGPTQYVLQPVFLLGLRLYVAWVFFASGMVKIKSWSSTLYLFKDEYHVPFLPPELAAYLGTAAELGLPILIALGIFTRPASLALFIFNIVAVVSYPFLFTAQGTAGFTQHVMWGVMIATIFVFGPGVLSIDRIYSSWLKRR